MIITWFSSGKSCWSLPLEGGEGEGGGDMQVENQPVTWIFPLPHPLPPREGEFPDGDHLRGRGPAPGPFPSPQLYFIIRHFSAKAKGEAGLAA
jgi:hypothetical protein